MNDGREKEREECFKIHSLACTISSHAVSSLRLFLHFHPTTARVISSHFALPKRDLNGWMAGASFKPRANETLAFFVHFSSHSHTSQRVSPVSFFFPALLSVFTHHYYSQILTFFFFFFFFVLTNWLTSLLSVNHSAAPLPSDDHHYHHNS